jgi:hypothetical protein
MDSFKHNEVFLSVKMGTKNAFFIACKINRFIIKTIIFSLTTHTIFYDCRRVENITASRRATAAEDSSREASEDWPLCKYYYVRLLGMIVYSVCLSVCLSFGKLAILSVC